MSVVEANRLADGTSGPRWGADGSRAYKERWEVITDNEDDDISVVLAFSSLPRQFVSAHRWDAAAFCTDLDANQHEDDPTYWILDFDYKTRVPEFAQGTAAGGNQGGSGGEPPAHEQNPLDRRPKVRITSRHEKRPMLRDLDGRLIKNLAGTLYEPRQQDVSVCVIHVERNIPDFDFTLVNTCNGAVNATGFLGFIDRQVKCENLTADENWDQGVYYWKVSGDFIVGTDDLIPIAFDAGVEASYLGYWYDWRINAGLEHLDGGVLKPIFVQGQRPSRPLLLDAAGGLLNDTGLLASASDQPIWIGFRVLRDADLGALGLFN